MDSLADRHYEPIYRFANLWWLVLLQQDEMKMPNMFDFPPASRQPISFCLEYTSPRGI